MRRDCIDVGAREKLSVDELERLVIEAMQDAIDLPELENMRTTRIIAMKLHKKLREV